LSAVGFCFCSLVFYFCGVYLVMSMCLCVFSGLGFGELGGLVVFWGVFGLGGLKFKRFKLGAVDVERYV